MMMTDQPVSPMEAGTVSLWFNAVSPSLSTVPWHIVGAP